MGKKYKIDDNTNHIIVYEGNEGLDITESNMECEYCIHDNSICGYYEGVSMYCDYLKMKEEYEEI